MNEPKIEDQIDDYLAKAWNLFTQLEATHPDHNRYFRDGIHASQAVLMWRRMQRDKFHKELYPTIKIS